MRKASNLQRALVRFGVPLLLLVIFYYAIFAVTKTDVSGDEVNTYGKVFNEEFAKTMLEVDKFVEEKLEAVFHPKPTTFKNRFLKDPIPIIRKERIKPFFIISPPRSVFYGPRDCITSNELWPKNRPGPSSRQDSSSSS
ncbi:uncharacterized protein LOC133310035 [Gastrolobium bilobum]|uniref:uncharacterized protein LOC133310035 n=1 Tax=Gastrolobium bilobum TaxID=150636 RepID=UPI002AB26AB3|nr:uncharacterized protein LOC133310035 [Gastrolobium bilobum]